MHFFANFCPFYSMANHTYEHNFFFLFLLPNSTFLHISFPGRQTIKATDFIFFHRKANTIFFSMIYEAVSNRVT